MLKGILKGLETMKPSDRTTLLTFITWNLSYLIHIMIEAFVKTRVVGVDISYDETTCAVVDIRGRILANEKFSTQDFPEISGFVNKLTEVIVTIGEASGGFEHIRSVGISSPSGNYKTGCIENSPNMPWKGVVPLSAMLRDRLGVAVAVGNDAHCIALGEYTYGCAHGMHDFLVITIGHGLGGYAFVDRHFLIGSHGFGGELGHSCMVENGRQCGCGLQGCLETYVAEKGIIQHAKELMAESDQPSLLRNYEQINPRIVTQCCEEGDAMAQEVYRRAGHMLGIAMANYAALLDPEAIIIAGGISKAGKWILEPVQKAFNEHIFRNIKGKVKIMLSDLDSRERDVLGASALAWEVKEYSLFK